MHKPFRILILLGIVSLIVNSDVRAEDGAAFIRPPAPDFKSPVNYMDWFRANLPEPTAESPALYGDLLYAGKDQPAASIAPEPGSKLAEQYWAAAMGPRPWSRDERPLLAAWLAKHDATYIQPYLAAAQNKPGVLEYRFGDTAFANLQLPTLENGRIVGRILFARPWLDVGREGFDKLFPEAVAANLAFAHALTRGATLDEHVMAASERNNVYEQIRAAGPTDYFNSEVTGEIAKSLAKFDSIPDTEAYRRALLFIEATAYDSLQRLASVDSNGKPAFDEQKIIAFVTEHQNQLGPNRPNVASLTAIEPSKTAARVNAYFDQLHAILAEGKADGLRQRVFKTEMETFGLDAAAALVVIPQSLAVENAYRNEATRRLAHTFVQLLEAYHKNEMKYPATLPQPAGEASETFTDPFSGKPFVYAVDDEGSIKLYSVGANGKDDGGDPVLDVVFWPIVSQRSDEFSGRHHVKRGRYIPGTEPKPRQKPIGPLPEGFENVTPPSGQAPTGGTQGATGSDGAPTASPASTPSPTAKPAAGATEGDSAS